MTNEERDKAIRILQWLHDNTFLFRSTEEDVKYATENAIKALEQEPCEDAISRQAVQDYIAKYLSQYLYNDVREAVEVIDEYIGELPSVKPQESSITWVTGADGAKIAFWDVPVWKVTKICEILGEPQERNEE